MGFVQVKLESLSQLKKLASSSYELVLLDSSFIVDFIDSMAALSRPEVIRASQKLPAICDFVKKELQLLDDRKVGMSPWKRLNRMLREEFVMVLLETDIPRDPVIERDLVRELGGGALKTFRRAYTGCRRPSNRVDQKLFAAAIYLRDIGLNLSVATLDRRLGEALEDCGIEVCRRPWAGVSSQGWSRNERIQASFLP